MGRVEKLLEGAKQGNREDMKQLLSIYTHLVHNASMVNGQVDTDLKQHLMMEFMLAVIKFEK